MTPLMNSVYNRQFFRLSLGGQPKMYVIFQITKKGESLKEAQIKKAWKVFFLEENRFLFTIDYRKLFTVKPLMSPEGFNFVFCLRYEF